MKSRLLLVGLVLAGACTGGDSVAPSSTTQAPAVDTTRATSTLPSQFTEDGEFVITSCAAPGEFALFCEGYDLIRRHYVDEISDQELADAAAAGVTESDETNGSGPLTCALPNDTFAVVCETAAAEGAPAAAAAEAALAGMVRLALDPNSAYFDPQALSLVEADQAGEVQGIGALVISEDLTADDPRTTQCGEISPTCRLVVVSLLEDSPAQAVGMEAGDAIVEVDGQNITGWTVDEVTAAVRGPAGTDVRIGILRQGDRLDFTITRAALHIPVVEAELVGNRIGYLKLNLFTDNSHRVFHRELVRLVNGGADWLVVDLRDNPGGSLDATVRIVSEFLTGGLVVRTVSPEEEIEYEVLTGGVATNPDLEVVILVNRGSASASEVLSAALQEAGRAVVIGENTFGKNTVQQRYGLSNGGALKLTVARWITAAGTDFGGEGVTPDVEAELPTELEVGPLVEQVAELTGLST